jgi:hypothetical protein
LASHTSLSWRTSCFPLVLIALVNLKVQLCRCNICSSATSGVLGNNAMLIRTYFLYFLHQDCYVGTNIDLHSGRTSSWPQYWLFTSFLSLHTQMPGDYHKIGNDHLPTNPFLHIAHDHVEDSFCKNKVWKREKCFNYFNRS